MKLSELTTDGALDALCTITPYIYSITSDTALIESVGKAVDTGKVENRYGQYLVLMDKAVEILPLVLKDHRTDVYGILSVLNQRTVEEIAAQNVMETIRQIREATQDEELRGFFKSFAPSAKSEPSEPSAPSQA